MPARVILQQVTKVGISIGLVSEAYERRTDHRHWRSFRRRLTRLGRGRRLQPCAAHSAELILRIIFMTALVTADYHKIKHKYNQFGCWIKIAVWLNPGCLLHFAAQRVNLKPVTSKNENCRQECIGLVLAREQKQSLIEQHRTHRTDTGRPEAQIG